MCLLSISCLMPAVPAVHAASGAGNYRVDTEAGRALLDSTMWK